ncbi:Transmembrane protein 39A [Sarcoptes scabiei]|nr:Transmembrane protein 39A [Sarcoptes scabiei]
MLSITLMRAICLILLRRNENATLFTVPEHVDLPELSDENELLYEMQTIVIFIIAMSTQYLNLYRTFWWMPDTYRRYAMNFHLINPNVVLFCLMTIVKSFFLHLFLKLQFILPSSIRTSYIYISNGLIYSIFIYMQLYLLIILFQTYSFVGLFTFLSPILIYSLIYSPTLIRTYHWFKDTQTSYFEIILKLAQYVLQPSTITNCFPAIHHTCTSISPFLVREEVEKLKNIFNDRLKFIIYRSIYVSYYGSFLPLAIVPSHHEYDSFWTSQHIAVTCMCTFFMLTSHLYSPQFYDILHRSSLHLGKWQKLESRNTLVPCPQWTESIIYGPGIVVRHLKEYYKSEANMTCAEPGNQSHFRFYIVFFNPACGFLALLSSIIAVIFFQFVLLCRSHEWYKLISISLLMLTNSLAVFRLMRSFWILKEIYKQERHFFNLKSE